MLYLFNPLSPLSDLYCTLEVDSFGFFSNKAKTRVYRYTTEPKWNEVRDWCNKSMQLYIFQLQKKCPCRVSISTEVNN